MSPALAGRRASSCKGGAKRVAAVLALASALAGCGYSTKSLLPADIRRIHVAPVKNAIDLSGETGDQSRFKVYRPGIEVELTNAIINRFIFDGNLRVSSLSEADAVVEAKLIDYRRDALRYNNRDEVQEYRVNVVLDVVVYRSPGRKVLWHDAAVIGDTTFFVGNQRAAASEDEAAARAVEDAARRVVEKTFELW